MQRKVLIVDDEVAFLVPMKKMLAGPGLQVDTAETFEQAIDRLHTNRYDAVIADVRLGGALSREGLAILDHIRKQEDGTKVIIMTGFGGPDIMNDAFELKADFYFEKPVSYRTLSEALGRLGVLEHDPAF